MRYDEVLALAWAPAAKRNAQLAAAALVSITLRGLWKRCVQCEEDKGKMAAQWLHAVVRRASFGDG